MDHVDLAAPEGAARRAVRATYVYLAVVVLETASSAAVAAFASPTGGALVVADALLALARVAAAIAAGMLILIWVHRVNAAAHAISGDGVSISPGWNVGWFFVPFANLWKPYQGLRESYQASVSPAAPHLVEVPQAMRLWWGLWIASNIVSNAAFRLQTSIRTPGSIAVGQAVYVVAGLLTAGLCLALVAMIREFETEQRATAMAHAFA